MVADNKIVARHSVLNRRLIIGVKLAVTGACIWYVLHQVNVAATVHLFRELDLSWLSLAVLALCLQIPLAGLRLARIFDVLGRRTDPAPLEVMTSISAIGILFGQILPTLAGEAARVWLLVRAGSGWRLATMSVVTDRGIGVFVLFALAFVILLFPSALAALGGYRVEVLVILGANLLLGVTVFATSARLSKLLARWPSTRQVAPIVNALHRLATAPAMIFIVGVALAIHALSVIAIYLLGIAQGLALPLFDTAVLFAVMTTIAILPITVSGWGLREIAVTALLHNRGFPPEQALFFSICFGLAMLLASALPGAVAWVLYSPEPKRGLAPVAE
jgi:uncharacterized membrane protein YbhN (UPF0104 family)